MLDGEIFQSPQEPVALPQELLQSPELLDVAQYAPVDALNHETPIRYSKPSTEAALHQESPNPESSLLPSVVLKNASQVRDNVQCFDGSIDSSGDVYYQAMEFVKDYIHEQDKEDLIKREYSISDPEISQTRQMTYDELSNKLQDRNIIFKDANMNSVSSPDINNNVNAPYSEVSSTCQQKRGSDHKDRKRSDNHAVKSPIPEIEHPRKSYSRIKDPDTFSISLDVEDMIDAKPIMEIVEPVEISERELPELEFEPRFEDDPIELVSGSAPELYNLKAQGTS